MHDQVMVERKQRWPDDVWAAIEINASREGMSAAEFVRIGALSYAAFCAARRGDVTSERFDALWLAARELLATYPI